MKKSDKHHMSGKKPPTHFQIQDGDKQYVEPILSPNLTSRVMVNGLNLYSTKHLGV